MPGKKFKEECIVIINHNLMAMNAHRQLALNNTAGSKSTEKLSSGYRINRAGDDAAGLAISEKMRGQIRGLNQASRNAQDGISLIQTAEGALNETHAILQRMRELAVQAASDTYTLDDRREIQKEINQLLDEIDRIANNTEFNTKKLIDGSLAATGATAPTGGGSGAATATATVTGTALTFGSGLDLSGVTFTINSGTVTISGTFSGISELVSELQAKINTALGSGVVTVSNSGDALILTASEDIVLAGSGLADLGLTSGTYQAQAAGGASGGTGTTNIASLKVDNVDTATTGGVLTQSGADAAITNINIAITQVSAERSKLGALQNRLEHTIKNLDNVSENLQASEARIRDLDMAKEMMEFTRISILQQAATAMLAQANQQPQTVLQLLR